MTTYTIKPEFLPLWGEDCTEDTIITEEELRRLSQEWEKPVEELREQLIEREAEPTDDDASAEKKTGFDAKTYIRQYIAEKVAYKKVNFTKGKPEDEEMIAWLEAQPEGISPYIKRLIRADMEARKDPEKR